MPVQQTPWRKLMDGDAGAFHAVFAELSRNSGGISLLNVQYLTNGGVTHWAEILRLATSIKHGGIRRTGNCMGGR
jgi:hypothetical protein